MSQWDEADRKFAVKCLRRIIDKETRHIGCGGAACNQDRITRDQDGSITMTIGFARAILQQAMASETQS